MDTSASQEFQSLIERALGEAPQSGDLYMQLLAWLASDKHISPRCARLAAKLGLAAPCEAGAPAPLKRNTHSNKVLHSIAPLRDIWMYLPEGEQYCLHVLLSQAEREANAFPQIHIGPHLASPECMPSTKRGAQQVYNKMLFGSAYALLFGGFVAKQLRLYTRGYATTASLVEVELYGSTMRIVLRDASEAQNEEA